ncbi:hypothetical protein PLICRDRAFT_181102 [Plicaturopsis crispa FD-325 SS-3]|uniref:Uncharacterized protein n=1 Tax=Plicaturopsis crispa FD-325 SS-3 TaxID=944288 RepID=A0A0C9T0V6_PLICR|nr:hypothetical protein PLICRDRAFT_181102 [Plicaturopsis crispa FD-325 SS-3]
MREACNQFNARSYETHGVVVVGAIVSVSEDEIASGMGRIFGTDEGLLNFLEANKINVRIFVDWLRNCIACNKYSLLGVNLPLLPGMVGASGIKGKGKATRSTEGKDGRKRDAIRTDVTDKFLAQIQEIVPDVTAVPWANWVNFAWLHKLVFDCWPTGLNVPGSGFQFKGLQTADLMKLLEGSEKDGKLYQAKIVRWSEEDLALEETSTAISTVPLVMDVNGQTLRRVSDSKAFLGGRREKKGKGKAVEVVDVDEDEDEDGDEDAEDTDLARRPVIPLPRRASVNREDNPPPLKRKRVDDEAPATSKRGRAELGRGGSGSQGPALARSTLLPQSSARAVPRGDLGAPARSRDGNAGARDRRGTRVPSTEKVGLTMSVDTASGMRDDGRTGLHSPINRGEGFAELVGPGLRGLSNQLDTDEGSEAWLAAQARRRAYRAREPKPDYEGFIASFGRRDTPPPALRSTYQRPPSVGPADSDADLPNGPYEMRSDEGFVDFQGHYCVPGNVPERIDPVERLQAQRNGGSRRRVRGGEVSTRLAQGAPPSGRENRSYAQVVGPSWQADSRLRGTAGPSRQGIAAPSRQSVAGPSRQSTAGPSRQSTAGPSRQQRSSSQGGLRLPAINERGVSRYRPGPPLEEEVDDDMDLGEDNIPRMMGYPSYGKYERY